MLLIWLLGAALALYSLRREGCMYLLFVLGGLLGIPGVLVGALNFGMNGYRRIAFDGLELVGVMSAVAGIPLGVWLVMVLVSAWTLPTWLTQLLPVRGIHARRLLAGTALTALAGPSSAMVALGMGQTAIPGHPVAGVMLVALGLAAYFAPLWNHLATCLGAGETADLPEEADPSRLGAPLP